MNVNEILDIIDDMLDKAWSLPLSGGKCVVDIERFRDLIGDVRVSLPGEIKQAKMIVADRSIILNDAKKEAETIIKNAEVRAKKLVAQEPIIKSAQEKANEMISQAHTQSKEIRKATEEFVDQTLTQVEKTLVKSLSSVKESKQMLRNSQNSLRK